MIFQRSIPSRRYRNYRNYRSLLRQDFRYRCAYCLVPEFYLGGEAGCCIDHHRPIKGRYARPELKAEYTNLYWCCRECNENRGDTWPSPEDYQAGLRLLDPYQPEDDQDLHWRIQPDEISKRLLWQESIRLKISNSGVLFCNIIEQSSIVFKGRRTLWNDY